MALIACHECGAKVSTEAPACPKCGAKPMASKPPKQDWSPLIAAWGTLLLIVLYIVLVNVI